MAGYAPATLSEYKERTFAMNERTYCVYKHTSPSGKVYIGITKQTASERWKNGLGYRSSPHFWSAIQKYGWENFSHEILFSNLCEEDACLTEQRIIAECNSMNRAFGYNERSGGQTGSRISEIVRERMSQSRRRFYEEHPEEKTLLSSKIRGFHHTEEARRKMSEAAKRRHYTLTDEWKRNIGNANRARLISDGELYEQTCVRCRENGKKSAKPIVQLDLSGSFVASFENAHEAERVTGIRNGNISSCCRGKAKSAGGYKWRYANEYNGGRETAQTNRNTDKKSP